jgi:3-oxoacyl-ACP reductase-like protein
VEDGPHNIGWTHPDEVNAALLVSPAEEGDRGVEATDPELDDKVAVVTGASKGIGLALVRVLGAEGAPVVAHAPQSGR